MTINLDNVFSTPDEIINIKGTIIVDKGLIPTQKYVKSIIHFIIRYSMKFFIDINIELLHIFSVCINKYIFSNVWYNK